LLLLALDSAARASGAALLREGAVLAARGSDDGRDQAEVLLPLVDETLRGAGIALAEVDGFAVAVGPGSFTGLRVGIATVKGLAFEGGLPVAPVSSLAARAWASGARGCVAALLDARRGEVYAGVYRREGEELSELLCEGVYTPQELAAQLPERCALVGEGARLVAREPAERRAGRELPALAPPEAVAIAVGRLGRELLARGRGVAAGDLLPRYLLRAEAEAKRRGERFEPAR
jgi:tRNA threonylcarbamoyladenosine biosynthesis protein TsaB